jgi:S1-C subfamily serine protease
VGVEVLVPDPDIMTDSILNDIVTDAVIENGSSGGRLLNMKDKSLERILQLIENLHVVHMPF